MIEVALVRHGETDWNRQGRMQGHRDIPLNANGLRQASRLAVRLSSGHWDMVVTSDLGRAEATAEQVARAAGIHRVVRDPRLRERSFGRLEGTTLNERIKRWGHNWHRLDHGTESDESLFMRVQSFLDDLARRERGRIVVVTHGGWIRCLFRRLFPELQGAHPGNTSVSLLQYSGGKWRCILYNDTSHLASDA